MKKNTIFFSVYKSFRDNLITQPTVSLGNFFELPGLVKKMGWRLLSASFPKLTKFNGRLRQLHNFTQHLFALSKQHGPVFVVKYLKSAQLAISKAIAGNPFHTLRELEPDLPLPRLSTCGLPSVIPRGDRRAILSGSPSVIRWWMTLFGLYRIIQIPGVLKISTITAPFSGSQEYLDAASFDLAVLSAKFKKVRSWRLSEPKKGLLFLETSSPNFVVSWLGLVHDLHLLKAVGLSESLLTLVEAFWGKDSRFYSMASNICHLAELREEELGANRSGVALKDGASSTIEAKLEGAITEGLIPPIAGRLGQLSFKEEAAGKVRVFAMVDVWTQSVLKPLHDSISSILKSLPNDGTFDQEGAVKRCFQKTAKAGFSYGYDLSAATDRLPISLQEAVMGAIFGANIAANWKKLLIERDYHFAYGSGEEAQGGALRYSVGQPMGALSSFNMLALTHHLIVQCCAIRCRVSRPGVWWDGYELLGDDIVIFDHSVSTEYLSFMVGIGMEVNVKKSVVASNNTFEFAKVTGHNGANVSGVSWKMFISQNSFIGRANIAFSLMRKGVGVPGGRWLVNVLKHRRYTRGDFPLSLVAVFSMFAGSRFIELGAFLRSILSKTRALAKPYLQIGEDLRVEYLLNLMDQALKGKDLGLDKSKLLDSVWLEVWPYLKAHKFEKIRACWNKYFDEERTRNPCLIELTDKICNMVASDFTTSPDGAPERLDEVQNCFDDLWWDIFDHFNSEMSYFRKELDHVGQEMIDEIPFETLEQASTVSGSIQSLLDLPKRAVIKIEEGGQPEAKFSTAVDVLEWMSAARKTRIRKVPMDWQSNTWDVWYP